MKTSTLLTTAALLSSMLAGPAFASGDVSGDRHFRQQTAATTSRHGEAGATREPGTAAAVEPRAVAPQAHACACGMAHAPAR